MVTVLSAAFSLLHIQRLAKVSERIYYYAVISTLSRLLQLFIALMFVETNFRQAGRRLTFNSRKITNEAKTEYKIVKLLNQKITHHPILTQLNLKLNNNKET
jgi:hypothetical protein